MNNTTKKYTKREKLTMKTTKKQDAKLIFSPQLANYLLLRGHTIIKLKPKRGTENETVFVFQLDEDLFDAIESWKAQTGNTEI
jgi:hypothetical protein